ncbi:2-hydroxyisoflavanone synthase [Trifolium repens]|nr:2-hydroxyisoflavanone synthase [Trifolium repens]
MLLGESEERIDSILNKYDPIIEKDETMEIKITKEQIKGLVVDFFSAGTDSTAVVTEWTLAELINNLRVLKKAWEKCFDLQVPGPHGQILKGSDVKVIMDERPGLSVPRAHNLVCVPLARAGVAARLLSS